MAFYSFIVIAPEEVPLQEYGVYLDYGRNVFNAGIDDITKFRALLAEKGVRIIQANALDEFEPVEPVAPELSADGQPPLLPGHGS